MSKKSVELTKMKKQTVKLAEIAAKADEFQQS